MKMEDCQQVVLYVVNFLLSALEFYLRANPRFR